MSTGGGDKKVIGKKMNALGKREFLHIHGGKVNSYRTRQVNALLTGPASVQEVQVLHGRFDQKSILKRLMDTAVRAFNATKSQESLLEVVKAQDAYLRAGGKL